MGWKQAFDIDRQIVLITIRFIPMNIAAYWFMTVCYMDVEDPLSVVAPITSDFDTLLNDLSREISKRHLRIAPEIKQQTGVDLAGVHFLLDFVPAGDGLMKVGKGNSKAKIRNALLNEFLYWADFFEAKGIRHQELLSETYQNIKTTGVEVDWKSEYERIDRILEIEYPSPFPIEKV